MNRLEKESLKKAVPFEELRAIRRDSFDLQSNDVKIAFNAAISLNSLISNSNCEIMIDQGAVSSTISFLKKCACDDHVCSACDFILALLDHELESVQELLLQLSGIEILDDTRFKFPNSAAKIVCTLQRCVNFYNAGQNRARESGVLQRLLENYQEYEESHPSLTIWRDCIKSICHLNSLNSAMAESHGFNLQYQSEFLDSASDESYVQKSPTIQVAPSHQDSWPQAVRSKSSSRSSRASSSLDVDNLPYDIGAQIRALESLKHSFVASKSDTVTTKDDSPSALLSKSYKRSQVGAVGIRNHLHQHEESNLNDVASRILGPKHFMDVIKRADKILNTDIPEIKTHESYGPQNSCFKTHGSAAMEAWQRVRYVEHVPTGSLGTKYGQHEKTFVKWFYSGQVRGDQAHGHGIIRWLSGSQYSGQVINDKRHGLGKMVFDTADMSMASLLCTTAGTTYYGQWENDRIHGIGIFDFHRNDGGGSLCGIFDQGMVTPYSFSKELLPENFIDEVRLEERKACALSAEAIQHTTPTVFRHNYESSDGQYLFPLHYTPQRALVQRPGKVGEDFTSVSGARF